MSPVRFFLKEFLKNLIGEVMAERAVFVVVSAMGFPSLSFEFTKNSSSNENDNVLIFRVIYGYRQL